MTAFAFANAFALAAFDFAAALSLAFASAAFDFAAALSLAFALAAFDFAAALFFASACSSSTVLVESFWAKGSGALSSSGFFSGYINLPHTSYLFQPSFCTCRAQ